MTSYKNSFDVKEIVFSNSNILLLMRDIVEFFDTSSRRAILQISLDTLHIEYSQDLGQYIATVYIIKEGINDEL